MLRRWSRILPVLALALASSATRATAGESATATALDAHRARLAQKREQQFRAADRNGDRALSREELAASDLPRVLLRRFDDIDTDHDGRLSPEELQALEQRQIDAAIRPNTVAGETATP
ncbi:hypothetical protein [Solimonas soli]|uniref:hypothetical protein n=1 Tax=Solimonas soli TaxID=413479 RepID=UPI0004888017|nr:hypothetical protein [Solimonas soli]